ncbi:MAG: thioesterase family protein [Terriglobia bacterium]
MNDRFPIGTAMAHEWLVDPSLTVAAHGTVKLPVLATPQLIFMLEDTCVLAVQRLLEEGETTVGTSVHVDHLAASKVGERIRAVAELVSVRGRRLVFRVEARTGEQVVARGLHERAVIDKQRFEASLKQSWSVGPANQ